MKAYRRKICHPVFKNVETLDGLTETVIDILRQFSKARTLPRGLTTKKDTEGNMMWAVHLDAPKVIDGWVSMSPEDVGAPQNTLWLGFNEEQSDYAVLCVTERQGRPFLQLKYLQSLSGFGYKDHELM